MRLIACILAVTSLLLGLALPAQAQSIAAGAYAADGTQPDACACAAAGAPALTCSLASVGGGVEPRCSVAPITTAGTYSVTITVTRKEKITNTTGGGSFVPASEATSAPFAYTRGGAALPPPIVQGLRTP